MVFHQPKMSIISKKVGNTIVERIEEYRAANDSLPDSLAGIGLDESIRITIDDKDGTLFCYEKVDSLNYIVWFGTTLGDGIYYYWVNVKSRL